MERDSQDGPTGQAETALFSTIARDALSYLRKSIGFGLWMVTRTEGETWIVLEAEDHCYDLKLPAVFRWEDSFCSRMVRGEGPRIAPRSTDVPAYAEAAIGRQVSIGAYIGVPLVNYDGSLFGTLCAIDPQPQPESIVAKLPLIELIAGMLSGVLSAEIRAGQLSRKAERAQTQAETDCLTGLPNRRGWDLALSIEETRCERYGHPACVIAVDIDGLKAVNDTFGHAAGDDLIVRAAATLRSAVRDVDVVARIGGDEFLVLGIECGWPDSQAILRRVSTMLDEAGVSASVGLSQRTPTAGLSAAVQEADHNMYAEKKNRKRAPAQNNLRRDPIEIVAA